MTPTTTRPAPRETLTDRAVSAAAAAVLAIPYVRRFLGWILDVGTPACDELAPSSATRRCIAARGHQERGEPHRSADGVSWNIARPAEPPPAVEVLPLG